jgi:hypothetical protein
MMVAESPESTCCGIWDAQAGLQRSDRGREEHGQCAGTLPSTRQQGVDVLVAVDVNPKRRARRRCRGGQIGWLFAVPDDVNLRRRTGIG